MIKNFWLFYVIKKNDRKYLAFLVDQELRWTTELIDEKVKSKDITFS